MLFIVQTAEINVRSKTKVSRKILKVSIMRCTTRQERVRRVSSMPTSPSQIWITSEWFRMPIKKTSRALAKGSAQCAAPTGMGRSILCVAFSRVVFRARRKTERSTKRCISSSNGQLSRFHVIPKTSIGKILGTQGDGDAVESAVFGF